MKTYLYTHTNAVAIQQTSIYRKALFLLFSTLITFFAFAGTNHDGSRADYGNVNKICVRTGGVASDTSGASDRMYSLYFKSFRFNQENQFMLPLVLKNFNASLHSKKVKLNWVTGHEKDLSHFVIERST